SGSELDLTDTVRTARTVAQPESGHIFVSREWALCPTSLNHFVRAEQQRLWDREAKRLRGLETDNQLELRRLRDGQIARLCPAQNPVDVARNDATRGWNIRPVGYQHPRFYKRSLLCQRRQRVLHCQAANL